MSSRFTLKRSAAVALVVTALGGTAAALTLRHADQSQLDRMAELCAQVPAEALVQPGTRPGQVVNVVVPDKEPSFDDPVRPNFAVRQGDVVSVVIAAEQAGGVAVHGLMQQQLVQPGKTEIASFRAVYGGRFPLHFHGLNGEHFVVATFEVS